MGAEPFQSRFGGLGLVLDLLHIAAEPGRRFARVLDLARAVALQVGLSQPIGEPRRQLGILRRHINVDQPRLGHFADAQALLQNRQRPFRRLHARH